MKWWAVAAVYSIAIIAVLWSITGVEAADYLGEACWVIDFGEGIPTVMQFGVSLVGPHLALTGKTNAFGVVVPVTGSAEVSGNRVRIHYTFSSPGGPGGPAALSYVFESGHMVLDSSLNGTAQMIDTRRNGTTGAITQTFLSGTAKLSSCPP